MLQENISNKKSQKKTLTNRRKELNEQILGLTKKLRPIDESIMDIDKLTDGKEDSEKTVDEEILNVDKMLKDFLPASNTILSINNRN